VTESEHSTSSTDAVGVIAVSRDDHWAHAYEDERAAVAESAFGRPGQDPSDTDFFDGSGRSLTPELGPGGELTALRGGDSPADPEAVRQRLRAVIAYAGDYLHQQQADVGEALAGHGLSADQAAQELPDLDGGSLSEDLRRARSLFGPHPMAQELQNRGSFLHNLFVHGLRT
jgi:hypothetical protein